tara:strand:- start:137 stop:331 length:195 start_codon:yes stop_codon:yes gene_type:complete
MWEGFIQALHDPYVGFIAIFLGTTILLCGLTILVLPLKKRKEHMKLIGVTISGVALLVALWANG